MKCLNLFSLILFSFCLLLACSGNNSSPAGQDSVTDKSTSSEKSSPGNAHFSCVVDGQPVSGGITDDGLQQTNGYQSNVAYIVDVDQGKELLFYLSDPKSTSSQGVHILRFAVPNKTGTSSFGHDEDGWGIEADIKTDKDHQATYFSDSFTINIASLSATRVGGTFSGKFKLREEALGPDYKKEIEVTDGTFDIPFSTGHVGSN